ncbi:hypothetical protein [Microbulbifer sp. 2205BS26-8]|uniref:hypothetical protein n=1 Tax=Microbulbifer sp. 2205BS26-8 TaxID=3064386 RepID=UPI00273DFF1A|nr:hypothetical protein [Microbulbifer sp. 2205BS26-8]MDP5210556.1 hypothetical protein [Microbulbifer sp. 2205BS26-8]
MSFDTMDKTVVRSFAVGFAALLIGMAAFFYNWNLYGGGWQYFRIFLFPGNVVLSLFTEEMDFWPKFLLQMSGQFLVSFLATYSVLKSTALLKAL